MPFPYPCTVLVCGMSLLAVGAQRTGVDGFGRYRTGLDAVSLPDSLPRNNGLTHVSGHAKSAPAAGPETNGGGEESGAVYSSPRRLSAPRLTHTESGSTPVGNGSGAGLRSGDGAGERDGAGARTAVTAGVRDTRTAAGDGPDPARPAAAVADGDGATTGRAVHV